MQYGILAFLSTLIGAIVGVGGGLIIRPMLSVFGVAKNLASFSSSLCVFFMGIVSLITVKKKGAKISLSNTIILAAGSICGAFLGSRCIRFVDGRAIQIAYIFVMLLVLLCMLAREKFPKIVVKNPILQFIIGLMTGVLSGFFGIGGGPFQVTVLLLFFGMDNKEAAVQSIYITLLTTISALIQYGISGTMDFSLAVYMVPFAILGGFVGGILNRRFDNKYVSLLFNAVVVAIILVQIYSVIFR